MVKISDAELEVIKIIWEKKETTSVEIIEALKNRKWTQNTIRTLIKRLQLKGAIEVCNKSGKMYTYRSVIDENEYKNEATKDLLKKLYNNSINEFVLQYCQNKNLTTNEIREIINQIDELVKRKED